MLETTIDSACGDPWFYGAGFVPGRPAFIGRYLVDIPTPGFYKLTLTSAPGGPAPLTGGMVGCTHDLNGMGLLAFVRPEPRLLAPGTYVLGIGFPARPDARGQATVRLEYLGPPTD